MHHSLQTHVLQTVSSCTPSATILNGLQAWLAWSEPRPPVSTALNRATHHTTIETHCPGLFCPGFFLPLTPSLLSRSTHSSLLALTPAFLPRSLTPASLLPHSCLTPASPTPSPLPRSSLAPSLLTRSCIERLLTRSPDAGCPLCRGYLALAELVDLPPEAAAAAEGGADTQVRRRACACGVVMVVVPCMISYDAMMLKSRYSRSVLAFGGRGLVSGGFTCGIVVIVNTPYPFQDFRPSSAPPQAGSDVADPVAASAKVAALMAALRQQQQQAVAAGGSSSSGAGAGAPPAKAVVFSQFTGARDMMVDIMVEVRKV